MTANTTSAPIKGTGDWLAIAGPGICYVGLTANSRGNWALSATTPSADVVGHPFPDSGGSSALPEGITVPSGQTLYFKGLITSSVTVTPTSDPA